MYRTAHSTSTARLWLPLRTSNFSPKLCLAFSLVRNCFFKLYEVLISYVWRVGYFSAVSCQCPDEHPDGVKYIPGTVRVLYHAEQQLRWWSTALSIAQQFRLILTHIDRKRLLSVVFFADYVDALMVRYPEIISTINRVSLLRLDYSVQYRPPHKKATQET